MTPSTPLVIVADDLSGAADTAVAFLTHWCSPEVRWGPPDEWADELAAADVLAVDTETRRGSAARARSVTFSTVEAVRVAGATSLFKKVDSTLRGHLGPEVAAALDAWHPAAIAIVAPAFPETGRTTVSGCQRVNHTPLVSGAIVPVLESAGLKTSLMSLDMVRAGGLDARLAERRLTGDRAVVCDAETSEDLASVARATMALGRDAVWVGSGGLARARATLGQTAGRSQASGLAVPTVATANGPVLVVVGSATATARRQAQRVVEAGVVHVAFSVTGLPDSVAGDGEARAVAAVCRAVREGRDVLVTLTDSEVVSDDAGVVRSLAERLRPVASRAGGVVVTGGETAMHLFTSWGITGLRLAGEVEPGVPCAVSLGRVRIPVVTKSGGFGDAGALERARRHLHGTRTDIREGE